jgi:hypothetical protein
MLDADEYSCLTHKEMDPYTIDWETGRKAAEKSEGKK